MGVGGERGGGCGGEWGEVGRGGSVWKGEVGVGRGGKEFGYKGMGEMVDREGEGGMVLFFPHPPCH